LLAVSGSPSANIARTANGALPTAGVASLSGAAVQPTMANLSLGTYQVSVVAVDSLGVQSPAATGQVSFVNANLNSMKVYPNPWRSEKHAGHDITFTGLTTGTTIKLFTLSGRLIKEAHTDQASWNWDRT